ncbi:MAG TPA: protein translocase subunit SecD [Planctomycetota bacterium]|nr:protein translocase subunit SecD [Planctomycetota bacterium]HRR80625.1 protein translocase subunit SecD [Planctomycetota bacterium]
MPKFWTNLVDSLPRESKSLTWRAPLVLVVLILSFLVFLPFRDTPYAIRVVHDTYDERGRVEPEARQVLSTRVTNWLVWFTSPFHYEMEREVSVKKLEPVGGREVRERTLEILSRGLNLGLDLRGGTELLYHILHDPKATGGATAEEIKAVVQRRIDAYGLREVRIQAQGAERLLVQLPGQEAAALESLKGIIQNIGHLEFRLVAPEKSEAYKTWTETGKAPPGWTEYPLRSLKEEKYIERKILVKDTPEMTGENIASTRVITEGSGRSLGPSVGLSFTPQGEREFARVTGDNVGEQLAIILNTQRSGDQIIEKGTCYSAPVIRTKIFGDAVIEGDFTIKEAEALCTVLRAGSLPAPLRLEHENTVGASLGSALISKGVLASAIGAGAVIAFMAVYYLVAGLIADMAVILNVLMLVSILILFDATLTLPGIAGLALTVGMAVDANVLIFERIREETTGAAEKPLRLAVREGFDRAFWTIFDSNLTTILTAIVLYWVGTGPIKGFGLTLTIGLLVNIFTAVVLGRVVFDILLWRRWITRLPMMQIFGRPNIGFMNKRFKAMAASAVLIAGGMAVFVSRGAENWDIDFRGGTMLHVVFAKEMDAEEILARLKKVGKEFEMAEVQSIASAAQAGRTFAGRVSREFEVRIPSLSEVILPPTIPSNPAIDRGTIEAAITLPKPLKPEDARQNLPSDITLEPTGQPDAEGRHATFKVTSKILETRELRAALRKALSIEALAAFQVTKADVHYPCETPVEFDRPVHLGDFQRHLRAMDEHVLVEPAGAEEGQAEYRKFHVKSTLADGNLVRSGIERAAAAVSLEAQVIETFKQDLAPVGLDTLSETDEATTLALNLAKPLAPALFQAKLASWELGATAKAGPANDNGEVSRFEIVLPTDRVDQLSRRIADDPQTFVLSDPIPRVAKVGPAVARELLVWAIVGVVAACLAIIAYVWVRFERIKYGAAGVLALVHDVLFTMGALAVLDRKFSITIIAALLTIIGYSINDTIVIFDRIRENLRKERKRDVDADLIDRSVNETLSRTIITSFSTVLAVASLLFFAGGVIQDFALTLLIGMFAGTYSTVFIASPILIFRREQTEKRLARG